jgi:hypothetical protein
VKTPEPPHPLHLHTISTHPTVVPSARCWHASSRGTDRDGGQSPFRWAPRQANRPGPLWQTPGRGNIFTFSKYRHSMCGCVVAEPWGKFLRRPSTLDSSVPEDDACRKVGPGADLAVGSGNCRGGVLFHYKPGLREQRQGVSPGCKVCFRSALNKKVACSRALQQGD